MAYSTMDFHLRTIRSQCCQDDFGLLHDAEVSGELGHGACREMERQKLSSRCDFSFSPFYSITRAILLYMH
jgi:hypothetical protein